MVCLMSAHNVIALSGVKLYLILTYHSICYIYYIEIVSCLHSNISFLTDSSHCMWLNQMYIQNTHLGGRRGGRKYMHENYEAEKEEKDG